MSLAICVLFTDMRRRLIVLALAIVTSHSVVRAQGKVSATDRLIALARLAALVPPPRAHCIHFYGVFAPAAAWRSAVVPGSFSNPAIATPGVTSSGEPAKETAGLAKRRRPNYSWSSLMKRVFEIDVLSCPACGGPMTVIAVIEQTEVARKILECLGLPSRAPPLAPARCE
jgi:hypothetical protein